MKTVIIEDEKAAVRNLTSLLNEVKPEAEIIAILDSINSTIEWFGIHPMPELVFMDIHLADGSAFEIFDHISITCPIIFTTAYDEYALRAFKVNSIDYLLKPIDPEELTHAVDKAVQVVLRKQENKRMQNLLQNTQALDKQKKIALSVADKIEFVEIGSIIRCESESNYTTFYLKSGEKLIVSKTLKEFDELLAPYHFLRVHQSHLINLDEIKSFIKSDGGYIRMKDGASVSISRQRRNNVMEVLKQL